MNSILNETLDPFEKNEKYENLLRELNKVIQSERSEHKKILSDTIELVKEQEKDIAELLQELKRSREQVLNAKELLNSINQKLDTAREVTNQLGPLKRINKELQERVNELEAILLNKTQEDTFNRSELSSERSESQIDLSQELNNLFKTMNVTAKDVITAIPVFSGNMKHFDSFLNTRNISRSQYL